MSDTATSNSFFSKKFFIGHTYTGEEMLEDVIDVANKTIDRDVDIDSLWDGLNETVEVVHNSATPDKEYESLTSLAAICINLMKRIKKG